MTYDLLLVGDLNLSRLTAALGALAAVPVEAVDVAAADVEERDWDAAVLCTYRPVHGDLSWSLDVYLTVTSPPSANEAAGSLAVSLETPVLYPAESLPPSAYWMALPDGSRTRARVYEVDKEEGTALVIDAVAKPVAWLPAVRVEAQPEVIREHRMPTPITKELAAWLAAEPLTPERDGAVDRLAGWEALTARMVAGWPPDGWYPAAYYQQDLENRDDLAGDVHRLPAEVAGRFAEALTQVDDAFRAATREAAAVPEGRGWWWGRLPDPPPWPGAA